LSAQEIVNWVTTADGCEYTGYATVSSRRRCVLGSGHNVFFKVNVGIQWYKLITSLMASINTWDTSEGEIFFILLFCSLRRCF